MRVTLLEPKRKLLQIHTYMNCTITLLYNSVAEIEIYCMVHLNRTTYVSLPTTTIRKIFCMDLNGALRPIFLQSEFLSRTPFFEVFNKTRLNMYNDTILNSLLTLKTIDIYIQSTSTEIAKYAFTCLKKASMVLKNLKNDLKAKPILVKILVPRHHSNPI